MTDAQEEDQVRAQKPNWVDKLTLVILVLTFIAITCYTCEAHRQNNLTQQVLETNTRPYIGVAGWSNQNIMTPDTEPNFEPIVGQRLKLAIKYVNYGKLPAKAFIAQMVAYSEKQLPSGPGLNSTWDYRWLWPEPMQFPEYALGEPVSSDEFAKMNMGQGWLYLKGEVIYDGGRHHTYFCREFTIGPSTLASGQRLTNDQLCQDHRTNDAN